VAQQTVQDMPESVDNSTTGFAGVTSFGLRAGQLKEHLRLFVHKVKNLLCNVSVQTRFVVVCVCASVCACARARVCMGVRTCVRVRVRSVAINSLDVKTFDSFCSALSVSKPSLDVKTFDSFCSAMSQCPNLSCIL